MTNKIQPDEYKISYLDLTVITLDEIFKTAQSKAISHFKDDPNLAIEASAVYKFNPDVRKFLLHYLLFESLQRMLKCSDRNKVMLIQPSIKNLYISEWKSYYKQNKVYDFIAISFKKLIKDLPFPVCISYHNLDFSKITSGESKDIIHCLTKQLNNHELQTISNRKLKAFTLKNGLTFINKYCESDEFKKLLY